MKTYPLIPLSQYVLEVDALSTQEFCEKFKLPPPSWTGETESTALQFIHLDSLKYDMVLQYTKFLNTPLTIGMFTPCDSDGKPFPTPKLSSEIPAYEAALKRVLFMGFERVKNTGKLIKVKNNDIEICQDGEYYYVSYDIVVEYSVQVIEDLAGILGLNYKK